MKKSLTLIILILACSLTIKGQENTLVKKDSLYPYILPIWGQKVMDRGIDQLRPFGLNLNYTYNSMDLYISEFSLGIGDDPNSSLNQALEQYVNLETLNFKNVSASTNGINLRADMFLFPFLNVYGLYASNKGNTTVGLQPEWYNEDGDLLLSLPAFGSSVDFDANTLGIGTTLFYGVNDYFISSDINYSESTSDLLDDPVKLFVGSMRVGTQVHFKNPKRKLAVYVGGMFRNFVEAKGNKGNIKLNEVFPELGSNVFPAIAQRTEANNVEIQANNLAIDALDPNAPGYTQKVGVLEAQNEVLIKKNEGLSELDTAMQEIVSSEVNYEIKKELINKWSVQFGFNFQINHSWMFRGEYGHVTGNTFLLTGLQYRFGF